VPNNRLTEYRSGTYGQSVTDDANRRIVERYFECLNAGDFEGLRSVFREDASLQAVGARPRNGLDEIVAYFPRIFGAWTEHRDEPTRVLVCGDTVTAEVRFTGTTPSGKSVEFDAVDVIDIEDGRIKRLTNWYDIAYAREQLAGG
jgi:ketosteroid isomerase-like protein